MAEEYYPLNIPPAGKARGGTEILRCAVIEDELHVTLRPGFDDPVGWGRVFAEAARQVARAYAHEKRFTEAEALRRIVTTFEGDMRTPPGTTGEISPLK